MVYRRELEKIAIDVPEKNNNDDQIVVDVTDGQDPSSVAPEFTAPEVAPLEEYEDQETQEGIDNSNAAANNIAAMNDEVQTAMTAVKEATDLVEKNDKKKDVTDDDVKVVVESFEAITSKFKLDNSHSECITIFKEDDLPPV